MKTSPVKILHVVHSLEPGGLENGIVNLSQSLDAKEFECHVFCLGKRGKFSERLRNPDNVYAQGKKPGFSVGTALALSRRVRALKPDLLHTHNLGPLIYGSIAKIFDSSTPLLHGEHSQLTEEELKPRRLLQRRWFYRGCDRVHTVSDSLKQHLTELNFPSRKLVSIPNGVDVVRFSPSPVARDEVRSRLGIPSSAPVIGIVGRFGPHKRHSVLLDAFSTLSQRFPALQLMIVGSGGPQTESVNLQAANSIASDRIHVLGFQEHPEEYYRCMDLLVVPSINEGLSNAVLESMACGVPALSHCSCGSAEAITHGEDGFVGDLSSAALLEDQISEILNDRVSLAVAGGRAREKVSARFSLAAMVRRYADLYWEILRRSGRFDSQSAGDLGAAA